MLAKSWSLLANIDTFCGRVCRSSTIPLLPGWWTETGEERASTAQDVDRGAVHSAHDWV